MCRRNDAERHHEKEHDADDALHWLRYVQASAAFGNLAVGASAPRPVDAIVLLRPGKVILWPQRFAHFARDPLALRGHQT